MLSMKMMKIGKKWKQIIKDDSKFEKTLILIFLSNIITISSYSIEPDVFVQSTVNRASEILSKISQEKKKLIDLK